MTLFDYPGRRRADGDRPPAEVPSPRLPAPHGFQSSSSRQGRMFAEQCDELLVSDGYVLGESIVLSDIGVEVDRVARSPRGSDIWFEYKGSLQGNRPGLLRTDTVKKAIANGALLTALPSHPPYVVLTSHTPTSGAARAMLDTARRLGFVSDVICVYDPGEVARLKKL